MRTKLYYIFTLLALLLGSVRGASANYSAQPAQATALGTGFTYQGQLKNNGAGVTASCDMAFRLFDDVAAGNQIGSAITTTVAVTNGVFSTVLNAGGEFGANAFDGNARWLRVDVRCGADSAFTTLTPRQPITAEPYAQYALAGTPAARTPYYPLLRPQSLDLATVDPALVGFSGGFTDGRFGYFVPNNGVTSGKIARVDLENFVAGGVTSLDLTAVDAGLKGFAGGFTDGRFGYFVPNNGDTSGKVARVDLQNFANGGVTVLDLATVNAGLVGFAGGFTDGRYGYFVAHDNPGVRDGKVARVDLQNFTTGGVTMIDLATVDAGLVGFAGGFTDGRYGYFVPASNTPSAYDGKVARVNLQNFTTSGVTVLDLATVDAGLVGFVGGFTDGRYGYFLPNSNNPGGVQSGKVARVDLQNFSTSGVTMLDLATVDAGLKGFAGGFTDGHYGYFVPEANAPGLGGFDGQVARVDLQNFTASGVTWLNMTATDAGLKGFLGGFTDGRYGYFVPNNNNTSGKVARIQLFSGAGAP